MKLHIPKKKAVHASYKRFRAKRTSHKQLVFCWRFIHFILDLDLLSLLHKLN